MTKGFWDNTPDLELPHREVYGKFGRRPSGVRIHKIPGRRDSHEEFVSKENGEILREITCSIIRLIKLPDVMKEWRYQIEIAFQESPGQKVDTLAKAYFILAWIHDTWGGLNKIITKELDAKRPENLRIRYYPVNCKIYLANVETDLGQKGLLSKAESPEKTQDAKTELGKSKRPEGKKKRTRERGITKKDVEIQARNPIQEPEDSSTLSVTELASKFDLPHDPLRKRLQRLRRHDDGCFIEVENKRRNQPRFLYTYGRVKHIIRAMKPSNEMPNERPTEK